MFEDIISRENLYESFLKARKGKRKKSDVIKAHADIERLVCQLHDELKAGVWRTGEPIRFHVYTDKRRDVCAPPFVDRIVHHALVGRIEPIIERQFIHHTYACRAGKGAHKAVKSLQAMMRRASRSMESPYVVQTDISKYFYSINHERLVNDYEKYIRCERTLDLLRIITQGYGFSEVGIPIGALTSQLSANFYMSPVDHYMTSELGVGMTVRYMDDTVLIVDGKEKAKETLAAFQSKAESRMLAVNPKSNYFPLVRGVDFCGYRIWTTHILPRKRIIKRARKKFKKMADYYRDNEPDFEYIRPRVMSFLAYMSHCDGHKTTQHILKNFKLTRGHHDHLL